MTMRWAWTRINLLDDGQMVVLATTYPAKNVAIVERRRVRHGDGGWEVLHDSRQAPALSLVAINRRRIWGSNVTMTFLIYEKRKEA